MSVRGQLIKDKGPFILRRLGRRLFWSSPAMYRWLGVLRGHGDCLQDNYEVWLGGYPRSANTFAAAAFKLANPNVVIASHFHIPTFIIHGLQLEKPGIFLIRQPIDSIVSWTIYWEGRIKLENALDYYLDFHHALERYKSMLFVVPFEETVRNFESVIQRLNARFRTSYSVVPLDSRAVKHCEGYAEDCARGQDGSVNELTVCRPSEKRAALKPALVDALQSSPKLANKLEQANRLYTSFVFGQPDNNSVLIGNQLKEMTKPVGQGTVNLLT